MDRRQILDAVAEGTHYLSNRAPVAIHDVRLRRRARAAELDSVHAAVAIGDHTVDGHRSPSDWLASTTGESIGQCKLTLRLAERIQRMPAVKASFSTGALAESALRLLSDAWSEEIADTFARDEEMLLRWGLELPHSDFKLVIETWRRHADPDREERTDAERFDDRRLHLSKLLDGMGQLDALLDPEGYAIVREAIRFHAQPTAADTRTPAQRRADALVHIARHALSTAVDEPGRKRRRPKVVATATIDDLERRSTGGTLDTDGDRITIGPDAIRRLACDAGIHRYISGPLGTVVDHGRSLRTVPDTMFDRLVVRDHGCRWPGCQLPPGGCDAHHATHWLDGGRTRDDEVVLLCWYHHHLLHEQHWSIEPLGAGRFRVHAPDGRQLTMRPPLVGLDLPDAPPLSAHHQPASSGAQASLFDPAR